MGTTQWWMLHTVPNHIICTFFSETETSCGNNKVARMRATKGVVGRVRAQVNLISMKRNAVSEGCNSACNLLYALVLAISYSVSFRFGVHSIKHFAASDFSVDSVCFFCLENRGRHETTNTFTVGAFRKRFWIVFTICTWEKHRRAFKTNFYFDIMRTMLQR